MRVCVIGTGYVGLVTGVCLAHIGHNVICVDNNEEKVKLMKSGQSPIFEPGLSELMQSSIQAGRIEFTTDLAAGVDHGEILFIAVGTPPLPTGESDTRYVEAVARGIGANLHKGYKVIVNKSTVPIGSGDWVRMIVLDGMAERQKTLVGAGGGSEAPAIEASPQDPALGQLLPMLASVAAAGTPAEPAPEVNAVSPSLPGAGTEAASDMPAFPKASRNPTGAPPEGAPEPGSSGGTPRPEALPSAQAVAHAPEAALERGIQTASLATASHGNAPGAVRAPAGAGGVVPSLDLRDRGRMIT